MPSVVESQGQPSATGSSAQAAQLAHCGAAMEDQRSATQQGPSVADTLREGRQGVMGGAGKEGRSEETGDDVQAQFRAPLRHQLRAPAAAHQGQPSLRGLTVQASAGST